MKKLIVTLSCAACLMLTGCGLFDPTHHATLFGGSKLPIPLGAISIKNLAVTKNDIQVPFSNSSLALDFEPTQLTNILISIYGTTNMIDWVSNYSISYPLKGGTMLIPITNNIAQSFFKISYSINVPAYTGN